MERIFTFFVWLVALGSVGFILWVAISTTVFAPPPPDSYLITVEGVGEFHTQHVNGFHDYIYFRDKETGKQIWIGYSGSHTVIIREE